MPDPIVLTQVHSRRTYSYIDYTTFLSFPVPFATPGFLTPFSHYHLIQQNSGRFSKVSRMSCFARNGSSFDSTVPCNPDALAEGKHTSCCANGDLCLTNGMCRSQEDERFGGNQYFRVGCTDKTWNDPACANYCEGRETGGKSARIFNCLKPKSWCCTLPTQGNTNQVNLDCCDQSEFTFEAPDPVAYTTANRSTPRINPSSSVLPVSLPSESPSPVSSQAPAAASSSSVAPVAPSSSAAAPSPSSQLDLQQTPQTQPPSDNTGVKVGLGVGLTLGFLLIGALIALFIVLRRRKATDRGMEKLPDEQSNPYTNNYAMHEVMGNSMALTDDGQLRDVKGPVPVQYYAHIAPSANPYGNQPQRFEMDGRRTDPVEMPATPQYDKFKLPDKK
ncbi:unnamed protein product [Periconia digitata]|uniref:Uncharacterized protein n=1 Tax=Periconia digitata TaxID=1303443 RepID=A0A9W4UJY7_9PLEO|nr:unnamed protein product [Periconia digitata]